MVANQDSLNNNKDKVLRSHLQKSTDMLAKIYWQLVCEPMEQSTELLEKVLKFQKDVRAWIQGSQPLQVEFPEEELFSVIDDITEVPFQRTPQVKTQGIFDLKPFVQLIGDAAVSQVSRSSTLATFSTKRFTILMSQKPDQKLEFSFMLTGENVSSAIKIEQFRAAKTYCSDRKLHIVPDTDLVIYQEQSPGEGWLEIIDLDAAYKKHYSLAASNLSLATDITRSRTSLKEGCEVLISQRMVILAYSTPGFREWTINFELLPLVNPQGHTCSKQTWLGLPGYNFVPPHAPQAKKFKGPQWIRLHHLPVTKKLYACSKISLSTGSTSYLLCAVSVRKQAKQVGTLISEAILLGDPSFFWTASGKTRIVGCFFTLDGCVQAYTCWRQRFIPLALKGSDPVRKVWRNHAFLYPMIPLKDPAGRIVGVIGHQTATNSKPHLFMKLCFSR